MVDSPTNTAPKDQPTAVDGIVRIWLKLSIDLAAIYYVVWVGIGIVQLLTWLQLHFQDIKKAVTGLTVIFEQLMESVAKTQVEEHPQPTEKNELHEKIGESTSDLS